MLVTNAIRVNTMPNMLLFVGEVAERHEKEGPYVPAEDVVVALPGPEKKSFTNSMVGFPTFSVA
jgi:hypothetical protein